ncbi:hypothetical protein D3C87_1918010 [compost metagenome]
MQGRAAVPAFDVARGQRDDLIEDIECSRLLVVDDRLVGPLHQQVDGRAAGILPFHADLVGEFARLVGVPFLLQVGEQGVQALLWGGEAGGLGVRGRFRGERQAAGSN